MNNSKIKCISIKIIMILKAHINIKYVVKMRKKLKNKDCIKINTKKCLHFVKIYYRIPLVLETVLISV